MTPRDLGNIHTTDIAVQTHLYARNGIYTC